jgi:low temperature requirement protein LtrA
MGVPLLIRSPKLWPSQRQHRRATWTELFFDLIFVAAVAEVGAPLATDYSPQGVVRFSFLFLLIWWAWSGHTLYTSRFEAEDSVHRLLILVQCFIAAVMAANAKDALDSRSSAGFGAAYAGMRIVLVIQYLRARSVPAARQLATRYAVGFGAAAIVWIVSALTEPPERYWLWTAALVVDFATPWLASKQMVYAPPDPTHFPERFGLFTIILIGEFVAAVMRGIEHQEYWSFPAASTAFMSMAFAFVLRGWYFDVAQGAAERHVRTPKDAQLFHVWHYCHLPMFLGIAVAGVGFQRAISLESGQCLTASEVWILTSAVMLVTVALTTLGATSEAAQKRRNLASYIWPQYVISVLILMTAIYGDRMHPVIFVLLLLLACTVQTLLAERETARPRLRKRLASEKELGNVRVSTW